MSASVSSDRSSSPERLLLTAPPTPRTGSPASSPKRDTSRNTTVSDSDDDDDFEHVRPSSPQVPRPTMGANGLQPPVGRRPSTEAAGKAASADKAAPSQAEAPAAGAKANAAKPAKGAAPAAQVTTVAVATPPAPAPKSKLEKLTDGVYAAALAVFAAVLALVSYGVQMLGSGWSWGRAKVSSGLATAKAKAKQAGQAASRWSAAGLRRVQGFAAPDVQAPTSRYAKAKSWVKTKVRGSCAYLLGKLQGSPAANPAAKPAATPAPKPKAS